MLTLFPSFYLGKKVAFVYRAQREVRGSKIRVIWGKITHPHGMSPKPPASERERSKPGWHGVEPEDEEMSGTEANERCRKLRCSTRTVQTQPATKVVRCVRQSHVVPFLDIKTGMMMPGSGVGSMDGGVVVMVCWDSVTAKGQEFDA